MHLISVDMYDLASDLRSYGAPATAGRRSVLRTSLIDETRAVFALYIYRAAWYIAVRKSIERSVDVMFALADGQLNE